MRIRIYDTTLRDGEQAPGFAMKINEKLLIAKHLEQLGVDVIEAGFPIASEDDFEAVYQIAKSCRSTEVSGLCRCHEKDISRAIDALSPAELPRIHVFIATSDIHLKYKLKISRDEAIKKAVEAVKLAKSEIKRVEFSCEDATRSDPKFLTVILEAVIQAGADVLNIPDTVGYSTPCEYGNLIKYLKKEVKGIKDVIISTHCHDDLGLAVANSLSGIQNGAFQIECTINGIGERAGNAPLEEIVMALKTRKDIYQRETNINTNQIFSLSQLVCHITALNIQPNKAIVGRNAFAHGAGIHQHGMLEAQNTYEIMSPEDIGISQSSIILSKHSGKHALRHRLKLLGIERDEQELQHLFKQYKKLADRKKEVLDEDLIMLALHDDTSTLTYELLDAKVVLNTKHSKAKIKLKIDKKTIRKRGRGNGPISALFDALIKATKIEGELEEFHVNANSPKDEAMGIVDITWKDENNTLWKGQGVDTDIVIAAGKSFTDMLNRKFYLHLAKKKTYLK